MIKKLWNGVKRFFGGVKSRVSHQAKKVGRFIDRRPFESFFAALGILLALIIISNILGTPKQEEKPTTKPVKTVQIYRIGKAPKLTVQGQITKSGVIKIVALTGGVVQRIYKTEGGTFYRGQTLVALSTNYQGGNTTSLQRKLAQVQRDYQVDTEQLQRDLIQKQRDTAEELNDVADETDLSKLQRDVTQKQLDIQSKTVDLNKEMSQIQLQIAQVNEASMFPAAPFAGTVDKVFIKVGQQVVPGTELMQINENIKADPVTAIAYVSQDIVHKVSRVEPSTLYIGKSKFNALPFYVSQDAVQGLLYAVYYDIPEEFRGQLTEAGFVTIDLPIGESDASALSPFVPIDAVYQTKESDYLLVVKDNKAMSKKVQLGEVFGAYVKVVQGLSDGDQVITDRNVVAGDQVRVAN